MSDTRDPRQTAIDACCAAADAHDEYRNNQAAATKPDGSPVTAADVEAEKRMRSVIFAQWPDDGFIGEENGHTPGTSGFTWIADPLDGTIQYTIGIDDFGTLLALTDADGTVVLGAVMHSPSRTVWLTERGSGELHVHNEEGGETFREQAHSRLVPKSIANAVVCFGHLSRMSGAGMDIGMLVDCFKTHLPVARFEMFVLVAEGKLDVIVARLEHDWDLFANQIIVEEAGGTVILLPLRNGRWVIAARSKELADQTVAAIKGSICCD